MVNLKIVGRVFFKANSTLGATDLHKLFLEVFRNILASAKLIPADFSGIAKPISGDFPPITSYDPKCHQRDSLFPNITSGSWGVVIAIAFFEFFGGYIAMSQNVFDDGSRALAGDASQEF
jgi:hypothetical protein